MATTRKKTSAEKITLVPLTDFYERADYPIKIRDDDSMQETIESVKSYGVLTPGTVRPRAESGYEIIAGRRRKAACKAAGLEVMPIIIKNLDDEQAIIEAETLFPSGHPVMGKCPRCGCDVTESKASYFCESNTCRFGLWQDNKYLSAKKITLTKRMASAPQKDRRTVLSGIYSERTARPTMLSSPSATMALVPLSALSFSNLGKERAYG